MLRHIKTLFRWARDTGILQINPVASLENPWKIAARERQMTGEEYRQLLEDKRASLEFKELVEFLWRTGARPGELCSIQAKHLDPMLPLARLDPSEHKTGSKTGRPREIIFPDDLMVRLRGYSKERPAGPLLRTKAGRRWTRSTVGDCFRRAKKRLGLPEDLCLYMARHAFITRLIDAGTIPALAAKISGNSVEIISKTYYHPDIEAMRRVVEQTGTIRESA
jgi:integrase